MFTYVFIPLFIAESHLSCKYFWNKHITSGVVIMLWKTKLKRVNLMDYLIQEKITTRHTLVKHQSLNEYSHVKRSCFLNAKFFLSSNCYITDHLRLEQFVFALVDPSAHYEEILTDIRRTFLVSANIEAWNW